MIAVTLVVMTSSIVFLLERAATPEFIKSDPDSLLFSNNLYFKANGDVVNFRDYHTLSLDKLSFSPSITTRNINDGEKKIFIIFDFNIYINNIMKIGNFQVRGESLENSTPIDAEAHVVGLNNDNYLQIIHDDENNLCFSSLTTTSIRCLRHINK
ncbi:hypothetical protein QWZ16_08315 [Vibrio ostreicida]|uniref:Uncharacterized protein n=2 Tax=Vibrio ostreicida TaxID=526588 RepID=A0ABT8BRK9_9VIBR|nr:hypothetical protein [Vibrio ostreicida]MDN3609705.1 hypothetical protein [Vibrio ostreicida]